MKKIMFFDIDGTLIGFNNDGAMTPKMIVALHRLREKGIMIGIATGRQTSFYTKKFKPITPMDFVVGSNGRDVLVNDERIFLDPIPQETVEKLIAYEHKYRVGLLLGGDGQSATYYPATEKCIHYLEGINSTAPACDPDFYRTHDILQGMIYCDEATEAIYTAAFPELNFIRHANDGIDIVNGGPLKEKGIQVVLDHFNLSREDALAFGDGLNDVGMFSYIDGVCLGVAHPELIKLAIEQTDTVENDGIYQYLERNNYI